mgnify:CR=1 FL=1
MRKISMFIMTILLTIVLVIIEIIIIRSALGYEPKTNIVLASKKIEAGETITEDMLEERQLHISMVDNRWVKDKNEIMGKVAKENIEEGEIIILSRISDDENKNQIEAKDKNKRLFTVELKGDQANGWQLKEGQYVDIIFIQDEKNKVPVTGNEEQDRKNFVQNGAFGTQRISNVRIAAIIDEKYVSFEVDVGLDEFLAYAKGNGRLEISVIPKN